MSDKIEEENLKRSSHSFRLDQLADLERIAKQQSKKQGRRISAAEILREGADYIIKKYKKHEA